MTTKVITQLIQTVAKKIHSKYVIFENLLEYNRHYFIKLFEISVLAPN